MEKTYTISDVHKLIDNCLGKIDAKNYGDDATMEFVYILEMLVETQENDSISALLNLEQKIKIREVNRVIKNIDAARNKMMKHLENQWK